MLLQIRRNAETFDSIVTALSQILGCSSSSIIHTFIQPRRKSLLESDIFACNLATFLRATSRRLLPFAFLESLRCKERSFFRRFFNGFGALTFSPLLKVAKSLIPKSIPVALPLSGNFSGMISTTKLRKYLSAASLITVTLDGSDGNGRLQTISKSPILGK